MTKLRREIIATGDGSKTIHIPAWNEQYHSIHGAIQEAKHVYIDMGLRPLLEQTSEDAITLLEIGFGTGLNALLTQLLATREKRIIRYVGVDAFPVKPEEVQALNYSEELCIPADSVMALHASTWEHHHQYGPYFTLFKTNQLVESLQLACKFNLIYYDAFGARVQPELWTVELFASMYALLQPAGVLVTYAAKGSVRRAMVEVGFSVERLKGPPGKREMLRATKPV